MNEGYIILPRAIMDEEYFAQKFTRPQALIDLYMLAAYAERTFNIRGNKVVVKRGQVAVAEQKLAERWHWSRNTVHKFLSELQQSGKVALQRSRLINIVSLNYYGIVEQQNEQQNEQPYNNINKENNKKDNRKKKEAQTIPDYIDPAFVQVMSEWIAYKRERGQAYKPRGLQACYRKLLQLSDNDPIKARKIIEQSMSSNYSGLFPLKNQDNGNTKNYKPSAADNIRDAQQAHYRSIAESISTAEDRGGEVFGYLSEH